ncbi:molybdenum cofactor biosynthesis protein MoaE [Fodinicurvata sp. EGI_FJ10296]|uniref:molybdenum cofactor biosynthesis protein MoaE n=1 Tax=Fodinicurvata sp. EGI_FJ10296 TaxID=3231908 RepID=UPI0034553DFA
MDVRVQEQPFDAGVEYGRFVQVPAVNNATDIGAVASFVGLVRGSDDRHGPGPDDAEHAANGETTIRAMTLEHYPGMTEKAITAIAEEAAERWPALRRATVIHRFGRMLPGEPIVLVLTASPHRDAAFDTCRFLMDWLKTKAPFWKLEETPSGERWVDARDSDDAAAARWNPGNTE